jgi:F-box protein 11
VETGKECLIFMLRKDVHWPRKFVDTSENLKKLDDLRKYLSTKYLVGFFRSPDDLASKVGVSVHKWEYPVKLSPAMTATTVSVSAVGDGDYTTISDAIMAVPPGSCILVKSGHYKESLIIEKPLKIVGSGDFGESIIESLNSSCVLIKTDHAVVQGLTLVCGSKSVVDSAIYVIKGMPIIENCDISSESSCVRICGSETDASLIKCKIRNAKSYGIYVNNGKGTVEYCDIFENTGTGVSIEREGKLTIKRSKICNGKSVGIFVYENGKNTVEDCDIFDNGDTGVAIADKGSPVIKRCKIHNGKNTGLGVDGSGKGTVEDCDIFDNGGVGVFIENEGNPAIKRCKIHNEKMAGIMVGGNGKGTVEDCDIFKNVGAGVVIAEEGNPVIKRCKMDLF